MYPVAYSKSHLLARLGWSDRKSTWHLLWIRLLLRRRSGWRSIYRVVPTLPGFGLVVSVMHLHFWWCASQGASPHCPGQSAGPWPNQLGRALMYQSRSQLEWCRARTTLVPSHSPQTWTSGKPRLAFVHGVVLRSQWLQSASLGTWLRPYAIGNKQ